MTGSVGGACETDLLDDLGRNGESCEPEFKRAKSV